MDSQFELDHFFICTSAGAPAAAELVRFGLIEGAPNTHPGQGTANRRFFFENAFLELVWVADPAEAQSEAVSRTGLWQRWLSAGREASPFGICLRPSAPVSGEAPFPAWEYRPPYLPAGMVIQMGTNSLTIGEPLVFSIDFRRPAGAGTSPRQPIEHPAGLRAISGLRIVGPRIAAVSPALAAVERVSRWLSLAAGPEHLLEVGFDDQPAGKSADFRPALPLIFRR